ncbi:DVU3141 family protein [Arsukibacterium sp.]|uniref:DVU3141 family protein n=1 Tax=Arsukibacterium sp. TaxID=1977258 RepID=UPI001BD38AA0|nr:DVU3141 family protein [Arsukibacterium sp.]
MQLSVHSFMQLTLPKPAVLLAGFFVSATFLSGCATTSSAPASYSSYAKAPQFIAAEMASQLVQARAGQQLTFSNSPWGQQVTAQVVSRYFSAAGRECLQLQLTSNSADSAVICRYNEQQWAVNRELTVANLPQE